MWKRVATRIEWRHKAMIRRCRDSSSLLALAARPRLEL